MMNEEKGNKSLIIVILIILGIILTGVAQLITWGNIDVETKIGGDLIGGSATLEAEFTQYSVDYAVETNRMGDSNEIKDNKIFLTGMGDFQANVGEILDSFNEKEYNIKGSTYNAQNERVYTNISVTTQSDMIPWWPDGMGQKCTIVVSLETLGSTTETVLIDQIWFEKWSEWDEEIDDYTKKEIIWQDEPNEKLLHMGDSKSYSTSLSIDSKHPRVGIVGRVNLSIVDTDGNQIRQILPFASDSHPTTINIYSMEGNQFTSVVLMVIAFPLTLLSLTFGILAIPLHFKKPRAGRVLMLIAGILGLLGVVLYLNGLNTLVELLDSALVTDIRAGYELNYMVVSLPLISAILMFVAFGLTFMKRPDEPLSVEAPQRKIEKQQEIVFKAIETKPTVKKRSGKKKARKIE
jgi:hypothetical protein